MGVPPALLEFEGSPVDMCRDIMGRSVDLVHKGYHLEDQAFIYQDASMLEHLRVLALNLRIPYRVLDDQPAPWERDAPARPPRYLRRPLTAVTLVQSE